MYLVANRVHIQRPTESTLVDDLDQVQERTDWGVYQTELGRAISGITFYNIVYNTSALESSHCAAI